MAISRITAVWSNFRGAPGYTNFFFDGAFPDDAAAEAAAVSVRQFFVDVNPHLPFEVNINIQGVADILDEGTGAITNQIDFNPPISVSGAGGGKYSAASGAVVNWNTVEYKGGRRVRGRTFLVPLTSDAYDDNGDLSGAALGAIRTAASDLITDLGANPLAVWSRPRGGAGGTAHVVSSATVPDMGAILRSRRD